LSDIGINDFLRLTDETPPVILCVLPDDFDQVQFGTVWRQIEERHAMFYKSAVDRCLLDVVMNRGVVEHGVNWINRSSGSRTCDLAGSDRLFVFRYARLKV
jgi:hypothetical protein